VADGWCWFVLREEYCWLVTSGRFVLREKYCWLVADKPSEQAANHDPPESERRLPSLLFFPLSTRTGSEPARLESTRRPNDAADPKRGLHAWRVLLHFFNRVSRASEFTLAFLWTRKNPIIFWDHTPCTTVENFTCWGYPIHLSGLYNPNSSPITGPTNHLKHLFTLVYVKTVEKKRCW
jgi:hypothetical protein